MAITSNPSYIPTMNEFIAHWTQCNAPLAPDDLIVRLPNNSTRTLAQFTTLRNTVQTAQNNVQNALAAAEISRGNIYLKKVAMLEQIAIFIALLDGYYQNTDYYAARPYAPQITGSQDSFTRPMVDMMLLWQRLNAGTAPAGVTLPIELSDGTDLAAFTAALTTLQTAYADERKKTQDLVLDRANRNKVQDEAYAIMKSYREAVPARLAPYPELIATLPRLTPLPGHTPEPVNASAVFEAPNISRVIYDASNDPQLLRYELRGCVGDHYDEQDAVVIATHAPDDERLFLTPFGLTQPGAQVALKVFVVLTTGNESGSAAMQVERPDNVQLLAA